MATTFKTTQNNAAGRLLSSVAAGDVTLTLASGQGALFPSSGSFWVTLYGTLLDDGYEICLCTSRTGDALTVTRAQQGTSARAWPANTNCQMKITAQAFEDIHTAINNIEDGTTTLANLNTGGTGLDVNPGSDTDADLLTVGVTGSPRLLWDESEDCFSLSKGLNSLSVGGPNNTRTLTILGSQFQPASGGSGIYSLNNESAWFLSNNGVSHQLSGQLPETFLGAVINQVVWYVESNNASDAFRFYYKELDVAQVTAEQFAADSGALVQSGLAPITANLYSFTTSLSARTIANAPMLYFTTTPASASGTFLFGCKIQIRARVI